MSYDLIFRRLPPGQTWDEYLAHEERDLDDEAPETGRRDLGEDRRPGAGVLPDEC